MDRGMLKNKKGFSLLEVMTTVMILGISVGLFYTTFYYNWLTMDTYATRSNLMQEMDQILDFVTDKVRQAQSVSIPITDPKTVNLTPSSLGSFSYTANGLFTFQPAGGTAQNLSYSVDPSNTIFTKGASGDLTVQLTLKQPTSGKNAILSSTVQVYPRN